MALDLAAIRAGLATRLATITGLTVADAGIDNIPAPPAAIVLPGNDTGVDYHQSFGSGLCQVPYRVVILVGRDTIVASQDLLDSYLSAGTGQTVSVLDAIYSDETLGGTVEHVKVDGFDTYGRLEWGGVDWLGAVVNLTVRQKRA